MTPADAAERIRAAKNTAVLIRYPAGHYDVVDTTPAMVEMMREIAPGWVVGVYPIVDGAPTAERRAAA